MARTLGETSRARKIFDELVSGLDDILTFGYQPVGVLRMGGVEAYRGMMRAKAAKRERQKQKERLMALQRLERQRYIEMKQKGGEILFRLTGKGAELALRQRIVQETKKLLNGQLCYVSFDVPENVREVREALRSLLRRAGFTMIHLSLWASEKDIASELAQLVQTLKAEKWIHVYVGIPTTTVSQGAKPKNNLRSEKRKKA